MTAIQQSGTITRNHLLTWAAPGVVQDAGSSATPGVNSLGIFGNGGTPLTLSNVTTPGTPTGPYSQLGLGISQTAAYLSVQSYNGAAPLPFNFIVNGQTALAISSNGTLNLTGAHLSLNSLTLSTPLGVSSGGTGLSATPAAGQLLIGNGSGYTLNTLTAGLNISIANTPGGITISSGVGPSGVLPVGSGGTGATTLTGFVFGNGTAALTTVASTGTGNVVLASGATLHGTVTFAL